MHRPEGAIMQTMLNRILFAIAFAVVAVDAVWLNLVHFDADLHNYLIFLFVVPLLVGGAVYYGRIRNERGLSAMMSGAAFLVTFPPACCLLSYLLLTVAGPRIDDLLASIDRSIGFSWPALMTTAAAYPLLVLLLKYAYLSVIPQTVLLLFLLGWKQEVADIYGFCLALALGAIFTLTLWTLYPSFGAFSVFNLPPNVARPLGLALDGNYGGDLVAMLKHGPGFISPAELRGIIGFPSYHTLQAVTLMWYARHLAFLRWPAIVFNLIVLVAVPIHGGHHLVDMFGGLVVCLFAIALTHKIVAFAERHGAKSPYPVLVPKNAYLQP
jgi:hypothetical protein